MTVRESSCKVSVSPDRLRATLCVFLPDDPTTPETTLEEALAALTLHEVTHGIDEEAVRAALADPSTAGHTVAQGRAPEAGVDGCVEALVSVTTSLVEPPAEDEYRVDWRWRLHVPQVTAGQAVARLLPAKPGRPGKDVTGADIPARPGIPAQIHAGDGVQLSPDGTEAVATRDGSPVITRHGRSSLVKVLPVLTCPGDIDLNSGNIRFRGTVVVKGNVLRGGTVVATEAINVMGYLDFGELVAGHEVSVAGKVFGSRIQAGLLPEARVFLTDLERFEGAFRQLSERGTPGHFAVQALLSTRFNNLQEALHTPPPFLADATAWVETARELFLRAPLGVFLDDIHQIRLTLRHQLGAEHGLVKTAYAQNAEIECTGKVQIIGQGCLYTNIKAGGDVEIRGRVRNCNIEAGGSVTLGEVGSSLGGECLIVAGKEATVRFGKAHPGTIVRIGTITHRFDGPYSACVRLAADGEGLDFVS